MKVLLVAPYPPPYGGISNWSKMLAGYMADKEDRLEILNIAPQKRVTEGRTLFDRVVVSGFDMLAKKRQLRQKIKEFQPDVIHMTTSGSLAVIRDVALMKIAKRCGIPVFYHLRFGKTRQMAESKSWLWKQFAQAMKMAAKVIAIDQNTYDAVRQYVPEADACLVPNPIDTAKLPPLSDAQKKQVIFVGWVLPTKGVTELVEAWNTVGREYPDYELVVIGQAAQEYLQQLQAQSQVPNIRFTGEMAHDLAMETVAAGQIFILPSYTEGFPNAVVEAMALKRTVIGTSVGAIPEMLEGDCGIVIPPKSAEAIVSALRQVLGDAQLRDRLAENAWRKVQEQYDIQIVYQEYCRIWSEPERK